MQENISWVQNRHFTCWWLGNIQYKDICRHSTARLRILMFMGPALNTLKQRQTGHHVAGEIFKNVFVSENFWFSYIIVILYFHFFFFFCIIDNYSAQAWDLTGDKPSPEPRLKCIIQPQWVKQGKSEGFDSCDRPSNLTQIVAFSPSWPWNLMDDPEKK